MKARSGTPVNGINLPTDVKTSKERPDLSILRKPIPTSITGFRETIQAYENGTNEIRNLLSNECDLIYECKACRNIFRSLANFISHKRIYCRANFSTTQHFHFSNDASGVDRDVATIVQAEQDFTAKIKTVMPSGKSPTKDLTSVIERLLRREHAVRPVANHQDAVNSVQPSEIATVPKTNEMVVLQFDKVKTSECAVFQTVRTESAVQPDEIITPTANSISAEVNEMHNLQADDDCKTLGPDGRLVHDVKPEKMTCDICQTQFDTQKTLRIHIKKYHVSSTFVYPCPSCPKTFFKPWAVLQHLSNDHKKSQKRIRQMRDTIMRRRTRISEIQVKGPSRELLRLQQNESRQHRVTWPDNYTGMGGKPLPPDTLLRSNTAHQSSSKSSTTTKHTSLCSYCGKTFERRAALSAHLKSCPSKSSSSTAASSTFRSSEADARISALQENDESNSNSADSFTAMLNREKCIQAKILEQEQLIASTKTVMASETIAGDNETVVNLNGDMKPNKNKRKRFKAQKVPIDVETVDVYDSPVKLFAFLDDNFLKSQNSTREPIKAKKPKLSLDDDQLQTDCSMCDRKFANLSNLRRHVAMLHYREKKFGCTLCQFQAFRRVDVLNHLVTVHSLNGDKQRLLVFVKLIALDKNKFSVEKDKAIADAVLRMQQKLPLGIGLTVDEDMLDESSQCDLALNNSELDVGDILIPLMGDEELDASMELQDIIPMDKYVVKDEITDDKQCLESIKPNSVRLFDPLLLNASLLEPSPMQERQKRRGRPKGSKGIKTVRKSLSAVLTPAPYVAETFDPPPKPSKLVRHSSSNSSSSEEQSSRRPVRNRIKAVNKDFVYDMSDLLKVDDHRAFVPLLSRVQKRKSLISSSPDDGFAAPSAVPSYDTGSPTNGHQMETSRVLLQVKGAALAMAQQSVSGNRACFNKHSEPPAERSIVPAKIIALRRSVGSDWQVMETPSPLNRRASNEQLLDSIARKKQAFDKLNHFDQQAALKQIIHSESIESANETASPLPSSRVENFLDELLKSRNLNQAHPVLVNSLEMVVKPLSPNINNNRQRAIQSDDMPRRKTLIERLAEIKTKKMQEHMQKLNISSGDENQ